MSPTSVLVTGATGVVGFEVVERLRRDGTAEVTAVSSRGGHDTVAWRMGAEPAPRALCRHWDVVVHSAASTRWNMAPDEARACNVASTEALHEVVGPKTRLVHVSTAYAVGRDGTVASEDLADYRNSYEWSKAASERVVRACWGGQSVVVRPPLIIGRRSDGHVARFSGMFTILRSLAAGLAPALIGLPNAYFDVVPVCDVGELIVRLVLGHESRAEATIVVARGAAAMTIQEVLDEAIGHFNAWRAAHDVEALAIPRILRPEKWHRFFLPFAREHFTSSQLRGITLLSNFEPYLSATAPLEPSHVIAPIDSALPRSVEFWSEAHRSLALRTPTAWKGRAASRPPAVATSSGSSAEGTVA